MNATATAAAAPAVGLIDARTVERVRAEFPVLESCVYLNSNSTGAMPRGMARVLQHYWSTLRRWRDATWDTWWAQWRAHADRIARLIGAAPGSVVTDGNLSTLLGRLASCFDYRGPRSRVVTTGLEFPAVPAVFGGYARFGAELRVVPPDEGRVREEALCAAIDERTKLVCVTHASFTTGALLDLAPVVARARAVGALVAVDAYQSVGAVPIDVAASGVDFLLGGAHKWLCGAIESAFLYVRPAVVASLRPAATGWIAGDDPLTFAPCARPAGDARRMASGTPAVLPCLLSDVALDVIEPLGIDAIRAHSLALTERVIARADEAGLGVATPRPAAQRGGIVALRFPGDAETARRLVARGYVCSHRGALRVAPHFYNTPDEVERFMDALLATRREVAP
jgi:selenocysteine lyase/cysteine desulfurase